MSQQAARECKYCDNGQQVNLYKGPDGKWVVTNLDGTAHRHFKNTNQQYQSQPQTTLTQPITNHEQVTKAAFEERQRDIKLAHEENIQASKNLTDSIQSLDRTLSLLTEVIRASTDKDKHWS